MAIKLRTGNTGEAVTSAADGRLYASLGGADSYVTSVGKKCTATRGQNKIIVQSGCILHNGRFIDLEGLTEWSIPNGVQAQKRSNLCVVRTTIDADGKERSEAVTISGDATPDGTPVDPDYNKGSLLDGATVSDFPLYRVITDGIDMQDPEPLFEVLQSASETKTIIEESVKPPITRSFSASTSSIASGATRAVNVPIAQIEGYTPVALTKLSHPNYDIISIIGYAINASAVTVCIRNHFGAALNQTSTVQVTVLYLPA